MPGSGLDESTSISRWPTGRSKSIVLSTLSAFAAAIASASVQFATVHVPSPGFWFELTV